MKYENAFIAFVLAGVRFALCMFECSDSQLFAIIINKVHYIYVNIREVANVYLNVPFWYNCAATITLLSLKNVKIGSVKSKSYQTLLRNFVVTSPEQDF